MTSTLSSLFCDLSIIICEKLFIPFFFTVVLPGLGEVYDELSEGAKCTKKFSKLAPLEKRKLLVKKLGIIVDDLFLNKDGEVMADNQSKV